MFEVKDSLHSELVGMLEFLSQHRPNLIAVISTRGDAKSRLYLDPGGKLLPWHDFVLTEIDIKSKTVHFIDPWDSRFTMVLSWDNFFKFFYMISYGELGGAMSSLAVV